MLSLKTLLKKSFTVHSAYKLLRDARDVPPRTWLRFDQITAVFKVLPKTMLPMPRLFDVYEAVRKINQEGIEGDLVECGVWNGGCVGLMAIANWRTCGPRRKIHLFDSFEGLPQPSEHDTDVLAGFRANHPKADLSKGTTATDLRAIGACVGDSQSAVEEFLVERLKIKRDDLIFHKGWFQDTIPTFSGKIEKVALLRLDGDWYDSTKVCLEGLFDRVVRDGFVIIDDYGMFAGCRQAADDFFRKRRIAPRLEYSDSQCVYFRKLDLSDGKASAD